MPNSRPTDAQPDTAPDTHSSPGLRTTAGAITDREQDGGPAGLSVPQIAAGALAAVTAAVAASFFGVAGTLIGAALGSVVSSVAAGLYATSLSRAARVIKVLVVRPADSATGPLE